MKVPVCVVARGVVCSLVWGMLMANASWAGLLFKMTAPKTQLQVGEELLIQIWAYADVPEATGLNGLNAWQLDMKASSANGGALAVKASSPDFAINVVAPAPMAVSPHWLSVNDPSGSVRWLGAFTFDWQQDSSTGVGEYSLLAEVTVVAQAPGTVNYELGKYADGDFYGALRDWNGGADNFYQGEFDGESSDKVFTIAPEPGGLMLLALAAVWRRRKTGR